MSAAAKTGLSARPAGSSRTTQCPYNQDISRPSPAEYEQMHRLIGVEVFISLH
jgi:hypothetical protein